MRIRGNFLVLATFALALVACRRPPATDHVTTPRIEAPAPSEALPARTENDLERTIRAQLDKQLSNEPGVRDREISFTVDNGDVAVTGTVRTEAEREKTNNLAIRVPGVRSVANALRVSP